MAGESKITSDHETIRKWVEEREGMPATVKGTGEGDAGLLRIKFPDFGGGAKLVEISLEEFFKKFDDKKLAFLYQEKTSKGKESRFFKFIKKQGGR